MLVMGAPVAQAEEKRELTVMTQNVYLGSSLTPALTATSGSTFVAAVAQIYGTMLFTNFPSRAGAIADTVAEQRPDLIGLQEVSRWVARPIKDGATPPSQDFLAILQDQLAARGLHYEVAAVSANANIGPVPLVAPGFECVTASPVPDCTLTLHDRDVILVNTDTTNLEWANPQEDSFTRQQSFQPPVGPAVSFDRGWTSIDGTFQDKRFRFVNTHLEVEDFPAVQEAQAAEFLAGPANAPGAVVAVGDFNSAADGSSTDSYAHLTEEWFKDAWSVNPDQAGLTCCQSATLTNPTSLRSRVDLILTHAAVRARSAQVVGESPYQNVTPLWASDHAGVVATLRLH